MLKPCIIGLGYVGLPLLVNLSKNFKVIGYDIDKKRILNLKKSVDIFKEMKKKIYKIKIYILQIILMILRNLIFI